MHASGICGGEHTLTPSPKQKNKHLSTCAKIGAQVGSELEDLEEFRIRATVVGHQLFHDTPLGGRDANWAEVCKLHGDEPTTLDDARKRCITLLGPGEYGVRMRDRTQNVVHFCLHGGDTHVMKGRVAFKGEEGLGVDHQVFGRVMEVPHIVLRIITTWS